MHLNYKVTKSLIDTRVKPSEHIAPHLHDALEIIYVTNGSLELGVGEELYHMEQGDIGIVFPNLIHHFQVLQSGENNAVYISVPNSSIGMIFSDEIRKKAPSNPVLKSSVIEDEVKNAVFFLLNISATETMVAQAYVQIILAKCLPKYTLVDKNDIGSNDLVYRVVTYIATNFNERITLDSMAKELGVSKYVISRVFSGVFHRNFNHYLNDARLMYAKKCLEDTDDTILSICYLSGFDSQRTFNRVFKEQYRVTPSEYRRLKRNECYESA